ncbi:MAG: hypothetical protein QW701_02830 [Candidatus Nezhaarchaeales archaeon]
MNNRVSVVAVGSPVHPLQQRTKAFHMLLKSIEDRGLDVEVVAEPISSMEEVWSIRHKILSLDKPLVILHLTGGTSKLAVEVAKWCNTPITLVTHGEGNSLPSGLETLVRLKRLGLSAKIEFLEPSSGTLKIKELESVFVGCMTIIGEVSPRTFDITCPATLAHRLKVKIMHLAEEELEKYLERHVRDAELSHSFLSEFRGEVRVPVQELQLSLALKEAIKEAVEKMKCNVFTVDCFEILKRISVTPCLAISLLSEEGFLGICEADVQAAACMIAIRELVHPFMGNIVAVNDESVTLAHCTAATVLASNISKVKLKSHFETDRSVAVDVPLRLGEAVMISCDPQLRDAYVVECYIDRSQLEKESMCRTQVLLRLKSKQSKVLAEWPGGHAVLAVQVGLTEVKNALLKRGFTVKEL